MKYDSYNMLSEKRKEGNTMKEMQRPSPNLSKPVYQNYQQSLKKPIKKKGCGCGKKKKYTN